MIDTLRNGSINSPFNQQIEKKNFTQNKRNTHEICNMKYNWLPSFELMDTIGFW